MPLVNNTILGQQQRLKILRDALSKAHQETELFLDVGCSLADVNRNTAAMQSKLADALAAIWLLDEAGDIDFHNISAAAMEIVERSSTVL